MNSNVDAINTDAKPHITIGNSTTWIFAAGIAHAAIIPAIQYIRVDELMILPGKLWLPLAYAMLLWPAALALSTKSTWRKAALLAGIQLLIISPSLDYIWTFTCWLIFGFGP